jgi:2-oxoisovalerate dehydrogenase E1 component
MSAAAEGTRTGAGTVRCVQALNAGLHELFEQRDDVYLIGEDLLDPYGGAFKASAGLSTRWPDRVLPTPISEASLFGIAAGFALRGYRPILEIMFGDFVALGFDQIVNGIGKFREMYDDQATVPLVVRTPMGGRRGYGPTHSQSLEKLLLGVPGIVVVTPSECHDLGGMLAAAVADDRPVFFIENKLMYGRPNRRATDGRLDEFHVREGDGPWPALTFSGNDFAGGEATLVTYGGMLPIALEAATRLILEEEVFTEVVVLGRLLPLDLEPVLESVARTGSVVTVEEGTLTAGVGAEIAARVQEDAWHDLRGPVRRVAARDGIVPAAPTLEAEALPDVDDVVAAVAAVTRLGS